ncbi:universal stress protein [Halonotius terrestris]|uniref:Universal stress protein n=1 Tax=Halonotius terrestris TaxID=2487750 RepID=A0A8J8PAY7_9EURY|nr:universal stress protein [Halonotius terrestris]TQQ79900.1 universal stress protein [Halonotius terrestris]
MDVLVGIGSPDESVAALERTATRAAATGDDVTVAIVGDHADAAREALEADARAVADDAGIDVSIRHVEGDPGSQLVDIAEAEGFEELVIGGGSESPMGKITIGSTAEFVLLNAHTTVTLVR